MDEPPSSSGDEPDEVTARVAEAFLAALRSGASQEQAGRLAAEADIDMRITMLTERMLEMGTSTSRGVSGTFRVGYHLAASTGSVVARSLNPGSPLWPTHTGKPCPSVARLLTVDCHS